MARLEIVSSGVAQFTKQQKLESRSNVSFVESNDQDKYVYDPERGLFAVADGVGGQLYGAEAAQAACDAFYGELCSDRRELGTVESSLHLAQAGLARIIHAAATATGGLTTFTGVYRIGDGYLAYLHAGDSELLMIRDDDVYRITSPQRETSNGLTNYMGGSALAMASLSIESGLADMYQTEWGLLEMRSGDRVVLATDGVTDATHNYHPNNEWWLRQSRRHMGAQALADFLVCESPRIDDSEAIVIDFGELPRTGSLLSTESDIG